MKKLKILITGSSGFIGKQLVKKLYKKNNLLLLDKKKFSKKNTQYFKIDLMDKNKLENFFINNKFDIIIHLASEIFDDDKNVYNYNTTTSKNLIKLAEKYNINHLIFTSTFSIYERNYNFPIKENQKPSAKNFYGKSKYQVEKIIKRSKIKKFTILRIPVVVGKARSHRMGILFELIRNNLPLVLINDGKHKIHFISVDQLTEIIEKCLRLKNRNLLNVGTNFTYTFKENIEYLLQKSKSNSKIINVNYYLGTFLLNTLIFLKLVDINFYHKALLTQNMVLNIEKAKKKLNLKFNKSSKEILLESYNYYIDNLNRISDIKSGSDKKPKMKIFNILRLFSFLFK